MGRLAWIETIGCCSQGHTTVPGFGRGGRRICIRNGHNGCNSEIVMVKDWPGVVAYMLLRETMGNGVSSWLESEIFEMLRDLRAWGEHEAAQE